MVLSLSLNNRDEQVSSESNVGGEALFVAVKSADEACLVVSRQEKPERCKIEQAVAEAAQTDFPGLIRT